MAKPGLHWKTAQLPENTAIFAIGDIHAQLALIEPLLAAVKQEIAELPKHMRAHVIFIGDYVDRGPDAPRVIDALLDFEREIKGQGHDVTFLCGNHDEIVHRLRQTEELSTEIAGNPKQDFAYLATRPDGSMSLYAVERWAFTGGGITTLQSYVPDLDMTLFDMEKRCLNREHPDYLLETFEGLLQELGRNMPQAHKDFFTRTEANPYLILGDYLFTHAGINPRKTLAEQGIGQGAAPLSGETYIDFIMIRDAFLWRDDLPNCPYVVIHGHTPSAILKDGSVIADGQKDYRLCIDTGAYMENGAITCFMRCGDRAEFISAQRLKPGEVVRYTL